MHNLNYSQVNLEMLLDHIPAETQATIKYKNII